MYGPDGMGNKTSVLRTKIEASGALHSQSNMLPSSLLAMNVSCAFASVVCWAFVLRLTYCCFLSHLAHLRVSASRFDC